MVSSIPQTSKTPLFIGSLCVDYTRILLSRQMVPFLNRYKTLSRVIANTYLESVLPRLTSISVLPEPTIMIETILLILDDNSLLLLSRFLRLPSSVRLQPLLGRPQNFCATPHHSYRSLQDIVSTIQISCTEPK